MALDLTFKPFSGIGIVTMYQLTGNVPGPGFDLGEAPGFDITQNAPLEEMKTVRSSSRGVAFSMAQSKVANLKITLNTMSDFTFGLLTSGSWTDVSATSAVTGWSAPAGIAAGNVIRLPARNVSQVSVTDSTTGTPKTLPPASYDVDGIAGTISVKDITTGAPYVQPFKVTYTPGAVSVLGAYKAPAADYLVLLNGTNAYNGDRVVLEAFKFRFSSDGESKWIVEQGYGQWSLNGSILLDESRPATSSGGQFYSLTKLAA